MAPEITHSMESRIKTGLEERMIGSVCVHYAEENDTLYISFEPYAFTDRNASFVELASIPNFDRLVINGVKYSYLLDMIQKQIEWKMYRQFFKKSTQ